MRFVVLISATVLITASASRAQYGDAYHKPNTAKLESERSAREKADRDYHYNRNKPSSTTTTPSGGTTATPEFRWQKASDGRPTGAQADEMRRVQRAAEAAEKAEQDRKVAAAVEAERIRMQDPAYRKKRADGEAARQSFNNTLEGSRARVRKEFLDAGFTAGEAHGFAEILGINPAHGGYYGASGDAARHYERVLPAKKAFDSAATSGSFEYLQTCIRQFCTAGESALRAQERLLTRFPQKAASARAIELSIIGIVLGTRYGLNTYYTTGRYTPAAEEAARKRWWEIYANAPVDACTSCALYGHVPGCPLIAELKRLAAAEQSYRSAHGLEAAKKARFADSVRVIQDQLLRIKFDPHADGSRKDIEEVRAAYYDICADKDRFLSYTNEDWQLMANAQRTTPQEMVRTIMHRNSQSKAGQRAGEKVLARLEKAGVR